MLSLLNNPRRAVVTLVGAAVLSTASLAITAAPASASLSWRTHACWCKYHRGRLHGATAIATSILGGVDSAILNRAQMTQVAIQAAQYRPDAAFSLFLRCQAHNRNALRVLLQNRGAVTRWLVNGGQC